MAGNEIKGIDPNFYFPEELIGVEYYTDRDDEVVDDVDNGEDAEDDVDTDDGKLQPPPTVTIVSQTVRIVKNMEVVDIVFELHDQGRDLTEENYKHKMVEPTADPDAYLEVQNLQL